MKLKIMYILNKTKSKYYQVHVIQYMKLFHILKLSFV